MASGWDALYLSLLYVGWPGLGIVSGYSIWQAARFFRTLRHSAPGLLVLTTILGWVSTLAGAAFIMTLFMARAPATAGPVVLPLFVLWAGSLITIVWVVYRWGEESQVLDTYYGEVERMERMKTGFINHVAHELNTPMTPLRMQVAVLKREALGPLNEKQRQAMGRIDRNVDRLGNLVEQVLMASALQSGSLAVTPMATDLTPIAERVARSVDGVILEKDGQVRGEVDAERIGYAIQTLALHLRASGPDEPVRIRLHDEGTSVAIALHHAGEQVSSKDFEMFGDPALMSSRDGLAIGMFNVHGIVHRHGGRLESQPGAVLIRLPVRQPATKAPSR